MTAPEDHGDLRATLSLSSAEACSGTLRVITLPEGRRMTLSIPPNSHSEQIIHLPGLGDINPSGIPGALIITLSIPGEQPAQSLTPEAPAIPPAASAAPTSPLTSDSRPSLPVAHPSRPSSRPLSTPIPHTPPPTPSRRRPTSVIVLLILLLILLGSSVFIYKGIYLPYQSASQATVAIQAHLTSTAQANVTATAQTNLTSQKQINATVTVQANQQATYDQITHRKPVLNDPLHSATLSNWKTGTGCAFSQGVYRVSQPQKGYLMACAALNTHYSDFAYQARMTILSGDDGGIFFRAASDQTQFYLFQISQDGNFAIYYYPTRAGASARDLNSGSSVLIHTGFHQANLLAVIAQGSTLNFYINQKYLTSVHNNSLITGQIGVVADDNTNPTTVVYSQVQVWNV